MGRQEDSKTNTASSAAKDMQNALKMGQQTARAAKTITKAASQAATGNVAGAAVSLLKDPETTKKILTVAVIFAIIFCMIIVLFLYALPTSIFEGVESYFDEIGNEWEEYKYSGGNDALWSGILATLKTGEEVIGDAANAIKEAVLSIFKGEDANKNASGENIDTLTDEDLQVTQVEASERAVLLRKVQTCIDKVDAREKSIITELRGSSRQIRSVVSSYLAEKYGIPEGSIRVNLTFTGEELSEDAAITLLSLYTVQSGASLDDVKLASLMKWLGWYDSGESGILFKKNVKYSLFDGKVEAEVPAWCGEFMPQYLVEQRKQEIEKYGEAVTDFSEYSCPAVDLCLYIDCPSLEGLSYTKVVQEKKRKYIINQETGEEGTYTWVETHYDTNLNITVRPRSATAIASIAGLWEGSFDDEQDFDVMAVSSGLVFADDGEFVWPLPGYSPGSAYGMRFHPIDKEWKMHTGEDIAAPKGTPIIAAGAGTVTKAGRQGTYGNFIEINHGDGYATRYAHLSEINVSAGSSVNEGDIIGLVGSTGKSTGPHLHFEVKYNGEFTDPKTYTYKTVITGE